MYNLTRRWKGAQSGRRVHWLSLCTTALLMLSDLVIAQEVDISQDLVQSYCSSENTADVDSSESNFQTLGLCKTTCEGSYALAVVRGSSCWCSDFVPGDTTSVSDCSDHCDGFPDESCGNEKKGLYGYMVLDQAAIKGTSAPSPSASPRPSNTARPETSPEPESSEARESPSSAQAQTIYDTVTDELTVTPSPSVIYVTHTKSQPPPSPPSSSSPSPDPATESSTSTKTTRTTFNSPSTRSRTAPPTWTAKPVTTVLIRTVSNQPVTQTVTSIPSAVSDNGDGTIGDQQPQQSHHSAPSAGLIAGVVIATVVGSLCIAGILFWCWRRRRQSQADSKAAAGGTPTSEMGSSRPTRTTSVLSKTGLLEKVYPLAASAQRSNGNGQNQSPHGNDASGAISPNSERRQSRPLFYDQRLNPTALMDIDNVSRVSVNTLPDNRDFSRTLNVTNPDLDRWD